MIESILNIDKELFYFINVNLNLSLLNNFFIVLTDLNKILFVKISLILFLIYIFIFGKTKSKFVLITLILAIFISDYFSSQILKNFFQRIRPCQILPNINLLVSCGSGFSFPSSHAVNAFTITVILSKFYSNYAKMLYLLAFLIAYSRVFVGVHYPLDIFIGILIGILISKIIVFSLKIFFPKFYNIVSS